MDMEEKLRILRDYRRRLRSKDLLRWRDYLEKVYAIDIQGDTAICDVCGAEVKATHVGSHFRQSSDMPRSHGMHVGDFEEKCLNVFRQTLLDHGYMLAKEKEGDTRVSERARKGSMKRVPLERWIA